MDPEAGLHFECQPGCTACCERRGLVYLTEDDILRAAAFLEITPAEFERQHVYRTANQRRLRIPRGRTCRFLLETGCSIHPAKPTQCRLFPFWPEVTGTPETWKHTGEWCPGIGQGPLIQIETVHALATEMRAAYPTQYTYTE